MLKLKVCLHWTALRLSMIADMRSHSHLHFYTDTGFSAKSTCTRRKKKDRKDMIYSPVRYTIIVI